MNISHKTAILAQLFKIRQPFKASRCRQRNHLRNDGLSQPFTSRWRLRGNHLSASNNLSGGRVSPEQLFTCEQPFRLAGLHQGQLFILAGAKGNYLLCRRTTGNYLRRRDYQEDGLRQADRLYAPPRFLHQNWWRFPNEEHARRIGPNLQ